MFGMCGRCLKSYKKEYEMEAYGYKRTVYTCPHCLEDDGVFCSSTAYDIIKPFDKEANLGSTYKLFKEIDAIESERVSEINKLLSKLNKTRVAYDLEKNFESQVCYFCEEEDECDTNCPNTENKYLVSYKLNTDTMYIYEFKETDNPEGLRKKSKELDIEGDVVVAPIRHLDQINEMFQQEFVDTKYELLNKVGILDLD